MRVAERVTCYERGFNSRYIVNEIANLSTLAKI